ncbi:MAG: bifunctional phosphopantothenoylcysteine decarboxylase/phosphopantothenate--cysteine ligase CoaBC [Dethiobacter sp.]|jgi:phosphopantothenoylcysteine decarboxylase/phosphopantothenate--cysteine ligase|nr:bifunctional phosphopantothenoylcysteine decarboxylase/phosphopantothenate--cysteine ligase CoaBC [Dethiobacter sp.]MBS3900609.1 bifunctional phosphopantothenoylcysteine decarboxylase/phosphopantothenate--cysteine ligase CoaBC [Dethiobacter sp.]MBS3990224.1 bifunctional phosphopantothenoylcysteine decarboxylase/phosphopantothenate--cysteine ligase CoaBC [Dethiobacter sp.]
MLSGKQVVLGVTGGIAAYKAVELCRLFVREGADVRVILTAAAKQFVTPLTFQTVSGNRVYDDLFAGSRLYTVDHVGLAQAADLMLVAPATANCLGKLAVGIADDLLTTTLLAVGCPVLLAPAMNTKMLENPAVQENIDKLTMRGYRFVPPTEGELACGDCGGGRLAPVDIIFAAAKSLLLPSTELRGVRLLVTAGPTREAIDPVRYLTNHSSGKMGYAVAKAAAEQGAEVTLVSGPVTLPAPAGVNIVHVTTAQEMYAAVLNLYPEMDVVVKAAAVADYRPAGVQETKIKKDGDMVLSLVRTPDILAELGKYKQNQILVGFAAETDNLRENALAKLFRKNLELIVANDLTEDGAGFNTDTNVVKFYFRDGQERQLARMSKLEVAREIIREIKRMMNIATEIS